MAYEDPSSKGKYCVHCNARKELSLQNISHGSHSDDFIEAASNMVDTHGWHEEGVMFLMEGPSIDYGIYSDGTSDGYKKRPAKRWYWIHDRRAMHEYPAKFQGGEYGDFVGSAIQTFHLKNAYMTNLVKCGMNDKDGQKYVGLGCYNPAIIKNCFDNYLAQEIESIDAKVIFAFGSKVYNKLKELIAASALNDRRILVIGLPHPAGQRRGFKDDYYQTLYFHLILKGLCDAKIIKDDKEVNSLVNLFLNVNLWSQQ